MNRRAHIHSSFLSVSHFLFVPIFLLVCSACFFSSYILSLKPARYHFLNQLYALLISSACSLYFLIFVSSDYSPKI